MNNDDIMQDDSLCSYPTTGYGDHESHCLSLLREWKLDGEWTVEVATDYTIQLDFDQPWEEPLPERFYITLEIFGRRIPEDGTASYRVLRSRSGNKHMVITTSWAMSLTERIAWQACFGSDLKRDALSLTYAALGQSAPVLLFSKKGETVPVIPIVRIDSRVS